MNINTGLAAVQALEATLDEIQDLPQRWEVRARHSRENDTDTVEITLPDEPDRLILSTYDAREFIGALHTALDMLVVGQRGDEWEESINSSWKIRNTRADDAPLLETARSIIGKLYGIDTESDFPNNLEEYDESEWRQWNTRTLMR